jgi:LCP family protein required for cell wall assembly
MKKQNEASKTIADSELKTAAEKKHRYSRKVRIAALVSTVVLTVVGVLSMSAGIYIWQLISLVDYDSTDTSGTTLNLTLPDSTYEETSAEPIENVDYSAKSVSEIDVRGNTKDITNIMLLGVDYSTGGYNANHSDTNIILSINKKTKTIKLISLLRDTVVTLPGVDRNGDGMDDYGKLNAAFFIGGYDYMSRMLNQNFRLDIDQYIGVNFDAFAIAVDAIGGLDVDLTQAETTQVPIVGSTIAADAPGFKRIGTTAGTYHLDGYQALQYARIRHLAGDDFARTSRQRKVVTMLLEKAKTMSLGTMAALLQQMFPKIKTNMSQNDLLAYAVSAPSYASYTIEKDYNLPKSGEYSNKRIPIYGDSLLMNDPRTAVLDLHSYIYE